MASHATRRLPLAAWGLPSGPGMKAEDGRWPVRQVDGDYLLVVATRRRETAVILGVGNDAGLLGITREAKVYSLRLVAGACVE